jgi:hypothetical protein
VYELVLNDHHSRKTATPAGHAVPTAPPAPLARFPGTIAASTAVGVPPARMDANAAMAQEAGGTDAISAPAPPSPTCVLPPFGGALNAAGVAAKPAAVPMQLLSPAAAAAAAAVASGSGGEDFMALAAELRVSNTELREKLAAAEEVRSLDSRVAVPRVGSWFASLHTCMGSLRSTPTYSYDPRLQRLGVPVSLHRAHRRFRIQAHSGAFRMTAGGDEDCGARCGGGRRCGGFAGRAAPSARRGNSAGDGCRSGVGESRPRNPPTGAHFLQLIRRGCGLVDF